MPPLTTFIDVEFADNHHVVVPFTIERDAARTCLGAAALDCGITLAPEDVVGLARCLP